MKLVVVALAGLTVLKGAPATNASSLDTALSRLYNFDFRGAHKILDEHIRLNPADPMGYTLRASALLFSELDRLQVLEGEFLSNDKRVVDRKKVRQDPEIRREFFQAINAAQRLAKAQLNANVKDENALFALTMSSGCLLDYTNFIDKKSFYSLTFARESHDYALRLLAIDPNYSDAYMTTGLSEYIIGSLPFFIRWFVHFDQVEGSKLTAIQKLKLVAESGRYLKPFAKILLAIIYLREKKPDETEKLLGGLTRDYPENPLFRKELLKLSKKGP